MKLSRSIPLFLVLLPGLVASDQGRSISGRVVTDTGRSLAAARVDLIRPGGYARVNQSTVADEEGRYSFDGVAPGSYRLRASSAGYVPLDSGVGAQDDAFYRPGDVVDLVLTKGGVISGRLVDVRGQPAIQALVSALPFGERAWDDSFGGMALTDDRGDYRIFGLPPGAYMVRAGGKPGTSLMTPHDDMAPAFFTQSASGRPSLVQVGFGLEAGHINIQLRDVEGFVVAGSVKLDGSSNPEPAEAMVMLSDFETAAPVHLSLTSQEEARSVFRFENVAAGDYRLSARRRDRDQNVYVSEPIHVKVRGRDVYGVTLSMARLPEISGKILPRRPSEDSCASSSSWVMEEPVIAAVRSAAETRDSSWGSAASRTYTVPDERGNFNLRPVTPGTYRLRVQIPDPGWYLVSLSLPAKAAGGRLPGAAGYTLAVRLGERAAGLKAVVAPGAALLRGRVISEPNTRLPEQLTVHLVPAETEQADNLLRFFQTTVGKDGEFRISNIPAGRYFVLARSEPAGGYPLWDAAAWHEPARAQLMLQARTRNEVVNLPACGRLEDYQLRHPGQSYSTPGTATIRPFPVSPARLPGLDGRAEP